ncbi:SGNH/GDSL hydrolase family protein [bacterium]|nr:SGNH/GDSL hydrolase family protein [bacterium]
MLKLLLTGLILGAVCSGCGKHPAEKDGTLAYLALGDSYTIGESVPEAERWPVQLADSLRAEGIDMGAVRIIAKTGWTTDELAAGIEAADVTGPFDLVSLLIGVNNQYRGRPVEDFRPQFVSLLEQAVSFAGGDTNRVFVVSIPDWGVTPFAAGRDRAAIAAAIDAYNAVKREETLKMGIRFFDITPISREAAVNPVLVASDGLHPSGLMYQRWVSLILPDILTTVRN